MFEPSRLTEPTGTLSDRPGIGYLRPMRRPVAVLGLAVGSAVYAAAVLVTSPQALCSGHRFPPWPEFGWTAYGYSTDFTRAWSPVVSANCRLVYSDGHEASVFLIDWPANLLALTGLVVMTVSALAWFRSRRAAVQ